MQIAFQSLIGGLGMGAIYVLVALGFTLVYRTMGLVNFAHGDVLMIGAFIAATFFISSRLPFWLSVIIAVAVTAILGLVIERILRPLENKDFDLMLIGTIGFGTMLEAVAMIIWGTAGEAVPNPVGDTPFHLGALYVNRYSVLVIVVAAAAALLLGLFLERTKTGIAMQASAMNHEAATSLGVNVGRSNAFAFAIGAGLAALAGSLAGPLLYVSPTFGSNLGIMGFAGAVLGGLGSIKGAIVGGLIFGVLFSFSQALFQGYAEIAAFVIFAIIVVVRPTGIFGEQTVDRA